MVSTVFVARISRGDASKVSRTTPAPRSATRGWCKVECRLPLARRTCASRKGKSPPRRAPPRTRISLRASKRQRWSELFPELKPFGVRHDDPDIRNVTYRQSDGRFCLIDFELATILPGFE